MLFGLLVTLILDCILTSCVLKTHKGKLQQASLTVDVPVPVLGVVLVSQSTGSANQKKKLHLVSTGKGGKSSQIS